jgi:hypothetical protein
MLAIGRWSLEAMKEGCCESSGFAGSSYDCPALSVFEANDVLTGTGPSIVSKLNSGPNSLESKVPI